MKKVMALVAVGEAGGGAALLLVPSLVGQWLFGAELAGGGVTMARLAGIALIGLSVACWPGTPVLGMLLYSASITLFFTYLGLTGGASGFLLWPAVVLHVGLTAVSVRASLAR